MKKAHYGWAVAADRLCPADAGPAHKCRARPEGRYGAVAVTRGGTQIPAEQIGREILQRLSAVDEAGYKKWDLILDAVIALTELHEAADDGELPQVVDGRDFKTTLAAEWDRLRPEVRETVECRLEELEGTNDENLYWALEARSAVQFLKDDFADTVATGLVDDEWLAAADAELRVRLPYCSLEYPLSSMPAHVPLSHWWWDGIFKDAMLDHVWLFRYGKPGDVTSACYVANRAYQRLELAQAALAEARAYFERLPAHVEEVQSRTFENFAAGWVPAWADFRERFVLQGAPLPARFGPQDYGFPPGWDLMMAEIHRSCAVSKEELGRFAAEVVPQAYAMVLDSAPVRLPRWSLSGEVEQWGFDTTLFLQRSHTVRSIGRTRVRVAALIDWLTAGGWHVGQVKMDPELSVSGRTVTATRDLHTLVAFAGPSGMQIYIDSPGYRADGPGWVVEDNRHRRLLSSPWQENSSIFPASCFPEKGDEDLDEPLNT
ncbi:hypothetical protein [Actinoplanes sp. NPDC020271]|uniref:hypothetical protein n=1 Tax=Actinoplanes sp. NPDC020271 TaxID=3363896 RepID=UPI0037BA59D5